MLKISLLIGMSLIGFPLATIGKCWGNEVGRWQRFEAQFVNKTWKGNPFALEIEVIFTSPSGRTINHLGFYAGGYWKIFFMPDELGKWTYRTQSTDRDLNHKSGSFICIDSDLVPPLGVAGRHWKLGGDRGDFPVIWNPPVPDGVHWGFRGRELSDPMVKEALRFAVPLIAPVDWAQFWPMLERRERSFFFHMMKC